MAAPLITPYSVLSFANVFVPKPRAEGSPAVYSCSLIFGPAEQKSKEYKAMLDSCIAAAREKFGDKVRLQDLMMPFRDAGEKADKYVGYEEGKTYVSPWTKNRPGIVDNQNRIINDPNEVYAGQIVRAQVVPFAWTNSGKKGVSFGLNHLQIIKGDAPRIDGRVPVDKAFGVVDSEEGDDDNIPF